MACFRTEILGEMRPPPNQLDGVELLLAGWSGLRVMVGDYIHDVEAGRRAEVSDNSRGAGARMSGVHG